MTLIRPIYTDLPHRSDLHDCGLGTNPTSEQRPPSFENVAISLVRPSEVEMVIGPFIKISSRCGYGKCPRRAIGDRRSGYKGCSIDLLAAASAHRQLRDRAA
jgi:hypothetical protein